MDVTELVKYPLKQLPECLSIPGSMDLYITLVACKYEWLSQTNNERLADLVGRPDDMIEPYSADEMLQKLVK